MKYAHLADLHLGSWREPKMRDLSLQAFMKAIDNCISDNVNFILFSGDLFNTSLPSLDTLKLVTKKLKELQEQNIPIYAIAGSHDFSPSGKTMLDVLENAGLLKNVCKGQVDPESHLLHLNFTLDQKTGAKITGMLGKKGQLDKVYYQNLDLENLEKESGYKIFLFHTTLSELKPKHLEKMESQPLSFLPKNFNYYAGGHVHHPNKIEPENYGLMTYPGALFPNNFAELEKYGGGGYYLITYLDGEQKIEFIPIQIVPHLAFSLNCNHKTPSEVNLGLEHEFRNKNVNNHLITLRLHGKLQKGRISEINFNELFKQFYSNGAYFVMKNTSQLESEEYEEIQIASNSENIEEEIIKEHLQQIKIFDYETEFNLTKSLLQSLHTTKQEGENIADFQRRVESEMNRLLGL